MHTCTSLRYALMMHTVRPTIRYVTVGRKELLNKQFLAKVQNS
jgi:hypothetical protein